MAVTAYQSEQVWSKPMSQSNSTDSDDARWILLPSFDLTLLDMT